MEASPISQEEALRLVKKLRDGSRVASDEIASGYYDWLARRMRNVAQYADDHQRFTAASDALFSFIRHPERYDPAKSPLASYLFMLARGDLLNALQSEAR